MKWLYLALHHYLSDDLVQLLLDNSANLMALDIWGILHYMKHSSHKGATVTKVLLKYGVNINVLINLGHTPLQDPTRQGHLEVVQLVLDDGTDMSAQNKYCWIVLQCQTAKIDNFAST